MFYIGKNISSKEPMQMYAAEDLFSIIKEDTWQLKDLLDRLIQLLQIDRSLYNQQKKRLPFFCISTFKDGIRHGENFESAHYLVIDFDKIPQEEATVAQSALKEDSRVYLSFITPSQQGLKVVFKLKEKIFTKKEYHDLGQAFGSAFAKRINLLPYLDKQTFDVTRASFISPDPQAYFNPHADCLDPSAYKFMSDPDLFQDSETETRAIDEDGNPDQAVFKKISERLNQKKTQSKPREELEEHWLEFSAKVQDGLSELEANLESAKPIQYGIQYLVKHKSGVFGEVNVYLGKKGYSVVPSAKGKLHREFTEIFASYIWTIIYGMKPDFNKHEHLRKV